MFLNSDGKCFASARIGLLFKREINALMRHFGASPLHALVTGCIGLFALSKTSMVPTVSTGFAQPIVRVKDP
jgi:hypothetical protein